MAQWLYDIYQLCEHLHMSGAFTAALLGKAWTTQCHGTPIQGESCAGCSTETYRFKVALLI